MTTTTPHAGDSASRPVIKLSDCFLETELDGELVLMNLSDGSFFALRDTGLSIWAFVDGTRDEEAIVAALQKEYAVDDATCRSEVSAFVKRLAAAGLVQV